MDLALFRTRAYRFSEDPRLYVLAERLEESFIAGRPIRPATIDYVRACLGQLRAIGEIPVLDSSTLEAEGIDVETEIQARMAAAADVDHRMRPPDQVVFIVGAPRSGTSHLYNLLAYTKRFSYLTNISCWTWPTWNLGRPGRTSFEDLDERFFAVDNRSTRLVPSLVVPYEAEDLYSRAFPVYRHLHGHTYEIGAAGNPRPDLLERSAQHHVAAFDRPTLLSKSPFNSFRILELERLWGDRARYIHILREPGAVGRSIEMNGFRFIVDGRRYAAEAAASAFVDSVTGSAPSNRLLPVQFDDLQASPAATIRRIVEWLRDRTAALTRP